MSQGREVHESTPVSRVMWSWDVARAGVVMPLAADLVSPRGLRGLGPLLRQRREERQRVVLARAPEGLDLPTGRMSPLGHVIMQSACASTVLCRPTDVGSPGPPSSTTVGGCSTGPYAGGAAAVAGDQVGVDDADGFHEREHRRRAHEREPFPT